MRRICAFVLSMMFVIAPFGAQAQTLADIRQELTVLFVEIQKLRIELNTTGAPQVSVSGDALQRLDTIEKALQTLTSKTESLEFRIEQVVSDGTNRVSDLEFRLCELEPNCDIANLKDTPSLGGPIAGGPISSGITNVPATTTQPELALSESDDFDRALAMFNAGDTAGAAIAFGTFLETYPGSPLSGQANYYLGGSLEAQNENKAAARAFLNSFSGDPQSDLAPNALHHIGVNLQKLGQTEDACAMWIEVGSRYPGSESAALSEQARQDSGCP